MLHRSESRCAVPAGTSFALLRVAARDPARHRAILATEMLLEPPRKERKVRRAAVAGCYENRFARLLLQLQRVKAPVKAFHQDIYQSFSRVPSSLERISIRYGSVSAQVTAGAPGDGESHQDRERHNGHLTTSSKHRCHP